MHTAEEIQKQFLEGTRMGATPVTHGIALPHLKNRWITTSRNGSSEGK